MARELLSDLADCARAADSRAAFRREAIARLRRAIGFEGVAWGPIPPGAAGGPLEYYDENVPLQANDAMALDGRARQEIARAQRFLEVGGVSVDGGFSAAHKERSIFFREFLARLHVGTYASILIGGEGRRTTALRLTRERKRFAERDLALLHRLRPTLRLAEALFDWRRAPASTRALTPRQRIIVEYVARGLSNREIACALSMSPNTVRNRLADAFERLGVSTRAELVAVALMR